MAPSSVAATINPLKRVIEFMFLSVPQLTFRNVALSAETLAHPMYLGIRGGKEIIKVIDKKLGLKLDIKKLEADIRDMESDMSRAVEFEKSGRKARTGPKKETSYIG